MELKYVISIHIPSPSAGACDFPMYYPNKTVCYVTLPPILRRCPEWQCSVNRRIWCHHSVDPWKWERYALSQSA